MKYEKESSNDWIHLRSLKKKNENAIAFGTY